jgi:hypothetical protein
MRVNEGLWAMMFLVSARCAGAAPLIDNDRVTVWDVMLTPGDSSPSTPRDLDAVVLIIEGGSIRTHDGQGHNHLSECHFGEGRFVPRGADEIDTLIGGGPAHEVLIALKSRPGPSRATSPKYPDAFPRSGAVKLFENRRVILWNYSWAPGQPTPMHIHDKDFVVAFRYDSSQVIVEPGGASHINRIKAGDILYLEHGLTHSEGTLSERQSAVYMELK